MRPACSHLSVAVFLAGFATVLADESPMPGTLTSGVPPLLAKAFDSFLEGQQRWAYTETHTSLEPDGRSHRVSDVRFDPSLPYDQQFVPLKILDRSPSEKEIKAWAERGTQASKRRHAAAERLIALPQDEDFRIRLLNQDVATDLDRATVAAEDESSVTFAIPLRRSGGPDTTEFTTFDLTARVGKLTGQFESASFQQRSTMRVGAGKYSDGLLEVEFAIPDAQFPAVPVKLSWRSTNKPLFGKPRASRSETVRTDLRRVTPYDERFKVKLAPLKLLEL